MESCFTASRLLHLREARPLFGRFFRAGLACLVGLIDFKKKGDQSSLTQLLSREKECKGVRARDVPVAGPATEVLRAHKAVQAAEQRRPPRAQEPGAAAVCFGCGGGRLPCGRGLWGRRSAARCDAAFLLQLIPAAAPTLRSRRKVDGLWVKFYTRGCSEGHVYACLIGKNHMIICTAARTLRGRKAPGGRVRGGRSIDRRGGDGQELRLGLQLLLLQAQLLIAQAALLQVLVAAGVALPAPRHPLPLRRAALGRQRAPPLPHK